MVSVDYAESAARLGLDVEQVLEVTALGRDLPALAGDTVTTRVVLSAFDVERSRARRPAGDRYRVVVRRGVRGPLVRLTASFTF